MLKPSLFPQALETNALLQGAGGAPELTAPLPSLSVSCVCLMCFGHDMFLHQLSNSLSLTTPTDLPAPVANGYSNSDRWSLKARTLTPPRDRISQDSESEDSYLQVSSPYYQPFSLSRLTELLSVGCAHFSFTILEYPIPL